MGFQACVEDIQAKWESIANQAVDGGYSQAYIDIIDAQVKSNKITAEEAIAKVEAVYVGQSAASIGYATVADLNADLSPADGTLAIVTNDAQPSSNGTYRKSGAAGTGSWVQSSYDRVSLVENELYLKVDSIIGKNKFNVDSSHNDLGYYVNYSTGAIVANTSYNASEFIPIKPNTDYTVSYKNQMAWYDANRVYVSGDNSTNTTLTSPANAVFARFTIATSGYNTFQVEEGTVATAFEPYRKMVQDSAIDFSSQNNKSIIDSIVAPQLENKANLVVGKNLVDETKITPDKFVDTTGYIGDNTTYKYSDKIHCAAGTSYVTTTALRYVTFYDNTDTVIGGVDSAGVNVTFQAPANSAYFIATFYTSDTGLQIEEGLTHTAYEPYRLVLSSSEIPQKLLDTSDAVTSLDIRVAATEEELANKADLTPSKNLVDETKITPDKFVSDTGGVGDSTSYMYSGNIECLASTTYATSKRLRFLTFYDNTDTVISGLTFLSDGNTFTTPAGCVYFIATFYTGDVELQIEQGSVSTTYEPFGGKLVITDLPDGIVKTNTTDFFTVGKNKFNQYAATDGYYYANGYIIANTTYSYSEYIKVTPSTSYAASVSCRAITFLDVNKTVLSYIENITGAFTTPVVCEYIVVSVTTATKDELQIEEGAKSTEYKSYALILKEGDTPIRTLEEPTDVPVLAIAPKQYVCSKHTVNIYPENIVAKYNTKYKGQVDISVAMTDTRWIFNSVSANIKNLVGLANTSYTISAEVYNDEFGLVDSKTALLSVEDETKTTPLVIQNIGDSYSGRMTWANTILNDATASANFSSVGIRQANVASILCDAQGGWTLKSFFTVDNGGYLSQFMQPVDTTYLYYGMTSFWIDANSASPSYNAADFDPVKGQFDATTGFKISPNVNDIMSDGGVYKVWDGSAWSTIDEATFGGFAFNYGQYRVAYNISAPDVLHVLLGTNDFAGSTVKGFAVDYADYKAKYDALIASVKADIPTIKIIVGIPVSSGRQGLYGTKLTEQRKLVYSMLADKLAHDYGNREGENIYLLDYQSVVDRYFGFEPNYTTPFKEYSGTVTDGNTTQTDYVHLSFDGFDQMGKAYMGLIQHLR